jgi:hypothetical protein
MFNPGAAFWDVTTLRLLSLCNVYASEGVSSEGNQASPMRIGCSYESFFWIKISSSLRQMRLQ